MMIMISFLLIWYAVGVAIVLHEMRFDMDVTLGWVMGAMALGILGPLWLLKTLARASNSIVLIKKRD